MKSFYTFKHTLVLLGTTLSESQTGPIQSLPPCFGSRPSQTATYPLGGPSFVCGSPPLSHGRGGSDRRGQTAQWGMAPPCFERRLCRRCGRDGTLQSFAPQDRQAPQGASSRLDTRGHSCFLFFGTKRRPPTEAAHSLLAPPANTLTRCVAGASSQG